MIEGQISSSGNTQILDVQSRSTEIPSSLIQVAAQSLEKGQVIAIPTDTIYGLAALAQNKDSVQSIYSIKGRASLKPIAICLPDISDVYTWSDVTVPRELLQELLPGPVTLLFKRSPLLNPEFNPLTQLVGIRIPDHPFIREVCRAIQGQPLALTSANRSSGQSSLAVEEFKELWPQLGIVFREKDLSQDSSSLSRAGSTILDLTEVGAFKVVREGCAFHRTVETLRKFGLIEKTT